MEVCCDLQVDVNGEEVFMVDKKKLASFSGRFRKLFGKLSGTSRSLKVIFHDFPGGAEGFELMARFCYSNGGTEITPSNAVLLYSIGSFMEMDDGSLGRPNMLSESEKFLEGISLWTWSDLVVALRQCQDLLPASNSSSILQNVLESAISKLIGPYVTTSTSGSSENWSFQFSSGRSSQSPKTNCSQTTWWFHDLVFLNINLIETVIRKMISRELDHFTIFKFALYYLQSKLIGTTPAEKCKITEVVINLLTLLDRSSLSWKGLFNMYQVALSTKVRKQYKNKLENMIASQLDQATIDYLLVPSPSRKKYVYDVNLVLRFVKSFLLQGGCHLSQNRLRRVANLMDLYLGEIAPDSHLNPSKFRALATVLPDSARESHDRLYEAIVVYFKRHGDLFEEEKMSICCTLNYSKLSAVNMRHLSRNSRFPPRRAVEAFRAHQSKLRSLFEEAYQLKTLDSLFVHSDNEIKEAKEDIKHIPLYTNCNKLNDLPTKTQKPRADLQSMHSKRFDQGNACGTMQMQLETIMKSRLSFRGNIRYLPTLFP